MKRNVSISLVGLLLLFGLWGFRQVKPEKEIMQRKLDLSHGLLEALAVEDFARMALNAEKLSQLSEAAKRKLFQTPDYARHSREFQRVAKSLAEFARERNLDNAALEFASLTIKCVQCHKHIRGVQRAGSGEERQNRSKTEAKTRGSSPADR